MLTTLVAILIICALIATILNAAGQPVPLWLPVFLLAFVAALSVLPLGLK